MAEMVSFNWDVMKKEDEHVGDALKKVWVPGLGVAGHGPNREPGRPKVRAPRRGSVKGCGIQGEECSISCSL